MRFTVPLFGVLCLPFTFRFSKPFSERSSALSVLTHPSCDGSCNPVVVPTEVLLRDGLLICLLNSCNRCLHFSRSSLMSSLQRVFLIRILGKELNCSLSILTFSSNSIAVSSRWKTFSCEHSRVHLDCSPKLFYCSYSKLFACKKWWE